MRALERLRGGGLPLACVSDWDIGLDEQLERIGVGHLFSLVLTSAEVGVEKPDPTLFLQIHRGTIVNVNAIAALHRDLRGRLEIELKQRREMLQISASFVHLFKQM